MKGGVKMNNLTNKVNGIVAKATLYSAKAGAGFTSLWGWHQPKVPQRISK